MTPGETMTRAQLDALATLANSKLLEGAPYKFFGRLHVFYCATADAPEVLGLIPNPTGLNIHQFGAFNSKLTSWWSVSVGDIAVNEQTNEAYRLERHPQTDFANWTKLTPSEFTVSGSQPAGAVGKAWYQPNSMLINPSFITGVTLWNYLNVWRDNRWERYGGWLSEMNRIQHNCQRALASNDPAKYNSAKAWLRNSEALATSGPWALPGGYDGTGFYAGTGGPGSFFLPEGGIGPYLVFEVQGGWQSGHQVKDIEVFWSDEVDGAIRPQYRITPEWSHVRVSAEEYALNHGDKSGFRYEGPIAGNFNAWLYNNAGGGFSTENLACSHPSFIKELSRVYPPVAYGIPPGTFFDWGTGYAVNGVRIEGTLAPGETFWIQHLFARGAVGVASGGRGYNGETIRGRFVPARHIEIDDGFSPFGPRASVGEPFAIYVKPELASAQDRGVLHQLKTFRHAKFPGLVSTWPMDGAEAGTGRNLSLPTQQTGRVMCGFVDRIKNAAAEVPALAAFSGKTIPPIRLNLNSTDHQLRLAPNAKGQTPNPFTVDLTDAYRVLDPVQRADNSLFYPYPCIRHDRTQTAVNLPDPYAGYDGRQPKGSVFRIDVRRPPVSLGDGVDGYTDAGSIAALLIEVGCVVAGAFKVFSQITLASGENFKTQRVNYPAWDAPIAYRCTQEPNVFVSAAFAPVCRVHQQGNDYQTANVYRQGVDGHKWISSPLVADDYNGVVGMLNAI